MTDKQMEKIKRDGLNTHLLREASACLVAAKGHLDRATQEELDFMNEIAEARNMIEDAEQLWKETYKL